MYVLAWGRERKVERRGGGINVKNVSVNGNGEAFVETEDSFGGKVVIS